MPGPRLYFLKKGKRKMATLIGLELRVGYQGYGLREVKVFPVHIDIPDSFCPSEGEITFHTSLGDATTMRLRLPQNYGSVNPQDGMAAIEKQLKEAAR